MSTLILSAGLESQLAEEARRAYPAECCGLVEGIRDETGVRVLRLHRSANLASDPLTGFEIDPSLHFRLLRTLRGAERGVVGCYHSHPHGRNEPSARDRANGCEEGFVWIILGVAAEIAIAAYEGPSFTPLSIRETP